MKRILFTAIIFAASISFADVTIPYIPYWETATYDGFGNANNIEVTAVYEFNGYHYAGTHNQVDGGQIYRAGIDTGYRKWELVGQLPQKHTAVRQFIEHNGILFAGTLSYTVKPPMQYPAAIVATTDGLTWGIVREDGLGDYNNAVIRSMMSADGYLYAGTSHSYAAQIYRSADGFAWEIVEPSGMGIAYLTHIHGMTAYKGALYAACSSATVARSIGGGNYSWTPFAVNFNRPVGGEIGGDDSAVKTGDVGAITTYRGYLVAGATDRIRGAALWAFDPERTGNQWVLASDFGIINGNTNNIAIHSMTVVPHPQDPDEEMLVAGTWGRNGASIFITTSSEPPFQWKEIGSGGFGFYSMAPHVRVVKRMGQYLYIGLSAKGLYASYAGKLVRIRLWNQ